MKLIPEAFLAVLTIAAMVGLSEEFWPLYEARDKLYEMKNTLKKFRKQLQTHDQLVEQVANGQCNKLDDLRTKFGLLLTNKPDTSGISNGLKGMKTVLNQKSKSVKELQNKNADSTNSIRNSIQSLPTSLAELIRAEVAKLIPHNNGQHHRDRNAKLDKLGQTLARIEQTTMSDLNSINDNVNDLHKSFSKEALKAACSSKSNLLTQHMMDIENLFTQYESKLNDSNVFSNNVQTEFMKLQDKSRATEECHNDLSSVLKRQGTSLEDIQKSFTTTQSVMKDLVTKQDMKASINQTLEAIHGAQYNVQNDAEKDVTNIISKLNELSSKQNKLQVKLLDAMSVSDELTMNMYRDVSQKNVMTNDKIDVLSTVLDVDLITKHGDDMESVLKQFKDVQLSVAEELQKQATELQGALGATIRDEMSKVEQHLGIVNKQLTSNKESLEELVKSNRRQSKKMTS